MKRKNCRLFVLLTILFLSLHANAYAWPTSSQWIPIYQNGALLQDPGGDAQGARNVVSDPTHDAAFIFNDGIYLYFRLRLDQNPVGQGGQGLLQAYGWGVEIDTNRNVGDYEWLLMVDGISQIETVQLWQNTIQGTLGDPADKSEILNSSVPLSGNYQIVPADTAINGDADYFLDWRFPFATFKRATGLSDSSPIRLFYGSSPSTNNLTDKGGDLVGASDLYTGFSDTITALGTGPATGSVKFVADLAGSGDVVEIVAGDTLYIRVDDSDLNYDVTTRQTLSVQLRTTSGDTALVTLTETLPNSGIFTASIPTQSATPVSGDGLLQVTPGATVSVEYIDAIDASFYLNRTRADSLLVRLLLPAVALAKSVDQATAQPGAELIYTVHYRNAGMGAASNLIIADTIPLFTAYVAGSMRIGNASSTYASAAALTDAADADVGQATGAGVIFTINTVAGDDGIANAGNDEGKIYFRVKID